jgi:transcriptional regulator with XRE-family HTH domain
MDYKTFGLDILVYRKRNGISQSALAGTAKISRNYLSLIERNEANNLSVDVLVRLAGAMEADPCDLLRRLMGEAK